nr:immunoglobulin heavy chain junction region [Macaca mulatta]
CARHPPPLELYRPFDYW